MLAEQVAAKGMSVRDTEKLARTAKQAPREREPRDPATVKTVEVTSAPNADIAALEHQLGDLLGLSVRIVYGETGGTLTLSYSTLDQLDMVCQRLTGDSI